MDVTGTAFPVRQKQLTLEIKDNKTDVIICSYDDHFFVLATQIGSMGTIIHARKEEEVSTDPTFDVSVIFGKRDEPMMISCGRQLIEHISNSGSSKPLVLSLGLKDHSMATLKAAIGSELKGQGPNALFSKGITVFFHDSDVQKDTMLQWLKDAS